MPFTKESVSSKVRQAFQGVTLGKGVGLFEADGIDDYADDTTLEAYREKDEKADWQRIPLDDLRRYLSSLCFLDPEGMRFHLPAFMVAAVNSGPDFSPVFVLAEDSARDLFALLSQGQREAVREFLLFIKDDPDHQFDRPTIEQALAGTWKG